MKHILFNIGIFFLSTLSFSQSIEKFSIDSGGASASAGGIQILYTIGEVNVQEYSTSTLSVSEGFINSYDSSTLAIDDFEISDNSIIMYPNPTAEFINISSNQAVEKVEIFDLLGKEVLNTTVTNEIKITHLPTGMYLVKVYAEKGTITKKIVIE